MHAFPLNSTSICKIEKRELYLQKGPSPTVGRNIFASSRFSFLRRNDQVIIQLEYSFDFWGKLVIKSALFLRPAIRPSGLVYFTYETNK